MKSSDFDIYSDLADSHMTMILIQWFKNFWDSPTRNFKTVFSLECVSGTKILKSAENYASNDMHWYGVYVLFVSIFAEHSFAPTQPLFSCKSLIGSMHTPYSRISFDAKFSAEFLFEVKNSVPPAHKRYQQMLDFPLAKFSLVIAWRFYRTFNTWHVDKKYCTSGNENHQTLIFIQIGPKLNW